MLQTLFIVCSVSLDALVVSFAYGTNKTRLSALSKLIIASISSIVLLGSMFIGNIIQQFLPQKLTLIVCVSILVILGIGRLIEAVLKRYLLVKPACAKELTFSIFGVDFKLNAELGAEHQSTEYKSLSIKEAFSLGMALSLDSIAVGIGVGLVSLPFIQVFAITFLVNMLMLSLGNFIGHKLTQKTDLDLGWLSGVILIILAMAKLS